MGVVIVIEAELKATLIGSATTFAQLRTRGLYGLFLLHRKFPTADDS
jgi:hypothetical protein